MKDWRDHIKTEDLPGDLGVIAEELGLDAALKLAARFGGGQLYIPQASSAVLAAKHLFIAANPLMTIKTLRMSTGLSDQTIIRIRSKQKIEDSQSSLFDAE